MNDISQLIRPDLSDFTTYSSKRTESFSDEIWLDANEMPWENKQIVDAVLNRYPQKQPRKIIEKLSRIYQINTDEILMLRGSDEAIDLLVRLFCQAGKDSILICPPTFGMYANSARLQGARVIEVPLLKNNFHFDCAALNNIKEPNLKILFICSPNNPTGNTMAIEDIEFLCRQYSGRSIVVVDEAYIEFSNAVSATKVITQYENLVILRTLSKAYGLAGVRGGFLLAQKTLVNWVKRIMPPYPLTSLSIAAVDQALEPNNLASIAASITCIKNERSRLFAFLQQQPWVKQIWPSEANFLFMEVTDAEKIIEYCQSKKIIMRSFHNKACATNCIRISIGSPQQNDYLLKILQEM